MIARYLQAWIFTMLATLLLGSVLWRLLGGVETQETGRVLCGLAIIIGTMITPAVYQTWWARRR